MLGFNAPTKYEQNILNTFIQASDILSLTDDIVAFTITLRKKHIIKLPDAIIAATAIVHNLSLLTRNTSDFSKIPDLTLINPHLDINGK